MKFGYAILATALLISITAEYYSIMGLTAIFAAATSSVIIMGVSLGLGKVVATVWCHNNWARIPLSFKLYLVPAIAFLMILTSLGTFGFLSKAHLEQSTNTGEAMAQVQLYDEKIKTQQENIESARTALKQLDATVNLTLDRSTDTGSVAVASNMRKRQAKERTDLQKTIAEAQKEIAVLQAARAPLAMEARKIEAEVGPIKYIAALIYGDSPDANLLERAVRWVIILIVAVFDPLALCLILAANKQFAWAAEDRKREQAESRRRTLSDSFNQAATNIDQATINAQSMLESDPDTPQVWPAHKAIVQFPGVPGEQIVYPTAAATTWTTTTHTPAKPDLDTVFTNGEMREGRRAVPKPVVEHEPAEAQESIEKIAPATVADNPPAAEELSSKFAFWAAGPQNQDKPKRKTKVEAKKPRKPRVTKPREEPVPIIDAFTAKLTEAKERMPEVTVPADIPAIPDLLNITDDVAPPKMVEVVTEIIDPNTRIKTFAHNWVPEDSVITADNVAAPTVAPNADFGTAFPAQARKGDTYLRVDYLPPKLYKFNGSSWMEVARNSSDSYAYNEEYIKYLIEKLNSGEYDVENLTAAEEEQIAEYLSRK